ncbi:MAG: D-alanyl-D-alanine carboxypeptidase/D-alanyl-D-alanine-endopeptidase, partial [Saprospiraceae bacterium]
MQFFDFRACCLLLVALSWTTLLPAQRADINFAIAEFLAAPELVHAQVGVRVVEVRSGRVLAAHRSGEAFIPASTQKLVTTAAALDVLGGDYRYETRLVEVQEGKTAPALYIVGSGDPTLGSPFFDRTADLKQLLATWTAAAGGITYDRVVGDGSYWGTDGVPDNWPWADLGNYYGAGAYGLNIHENLYFLDLQQRPAEGQQPKIIRTRPSPAGFEIINELNTGRPGTGDRAYLYAAPFDKRAVLRGTISPGRKTFTIKGTLPDPALAAAELLNNALAFRGTKLNGPPAAAALTGVPAARRTVLYRHNSPPLTDIIGRTNLNSLNLYAEALVRTLPPAADERMPGDRLLAWLNAKGLATEGCQLEDGSGLSPRNFITPRLLTDLLVLQAGNPVWRETIPVAGRTGSLRYQLRGTAAEGR